MKRFKSISANSHEAIVEKINEMWPAYKPSGNMIFDKEFIEPECLATCSPGVWSKPHWKYTYFQMMEKCVA